MYIGLMLMVILITRNYKKDLLSAVSKMCRKAFKWQIYNIYRCSLKLCDVLAKEQNLTAWVGLSTDLCPVKLIFHVNIENKHQKHEKTLLLSENFSWRLVFPFKSWLCSLLYWKLTPDGECSIRRSDTSIILVTQISDCCIERTWNTLQILCMVNSEPLIGTIVNLANTSLDNNRKILYKDSFHPSANELPSLLQLEAYDGTPLQIWYDYTKLSI